MKNRNCREGEKKLFKRKKSVRKDRGGENEGEVSVIQWFRKVRWQDQEGEKQKKNKFFLTFLFFLKLL